MWTQVSWGCLLKGNSWCYSQSNVPEVKSWERILKQLQMTKKHNGFPHLCKHCQCFSNFRCQIVTEIVKQQWVQSPSCEMHQLAPLLKLRVTIRWRTTCWTGGVREQAFNGKTLNGFPQTYWDLGLKMFSFVLKISLAIFSDSKKIFLKKPLYIQKFYIISSRMYLVLFIM